MKGTHVHCADAWTCGFCGRWVCVYCLSDHRCTEGELLRRSWALHALVLGTLAMACVGARVAHADGWTRDDTLAALEGAPETVRCIVFLESSYEPYAVGAGGEQGVAQLLPSWSGGGQWEEFWFGDWTSVPTEQRSTWNPYQAVRFIEAYSAVHGYGAWSTARFC